MAYGGGNPDPVDNSHVPRSPRECPVCGTSTINLGQHIRAGCDGYIE